MTEKVWVGKTANRENIFHTTNCRYVNPDEARTWNREVAEAWDFEECQICRDEPLEGTGPQPSRELERLGRENYPEKSKL